MFGNWIGTALSAIVAAGLFALPAWAQSRSPGAAGDHWVATWATSQDLMPVALGGRGGPGRAQSAGPRPPQAGRGGPPDSNLPSTFADQTVRMIVRTSLGGPSVRIQLANMLSARPLEVGAAHIAVHEVNGAVVDGTDRVLTFSGSPAFTIPPGALAVSDPVNLGFAPLTDLAISLYLPRDTGRPTSHLVGLRSAYISKGDVTGAATMPDPIRMFAYAWLSSVDVMAPPDAFAVVALGDSITDGFATTRDANQAWPTLLAQRLSGNPATRRVAVVNQGISGNQVLRDGAGLSALARFDRDVLSRPGVKWVVLLEGINDINIRGRQDGPDALTSEELIWGYKQLITRCHTHGIQVIGATIMPEEGVPTASERGEEIRQEVNRWIRTRGSFDALVDFDAAVRDSQRPTRLKPEFDPGDHIHPNDAGNQAMADAFDLSLFQNGKVGLP